MAWYKEKTTGKYWHGNRFITGTCDWNNDGDIYTDTILNLRELDGNGYWSIHEDDLNMFELVPESEVKDYLLRVLNDYYIDCGDYWCNPAYGKDYLHYGDRSFIAGGFCVYDNGRQAAIDKEMDYIFNTKFKEMRTN